MCDSRMSNMVYPRHPQKRHASRIGYKIMEILNGEKRILSAYSPDEDFTSGIKSELNPNGASSAYVLTRYGYQQNNLPRLHSEIAALQKITNSIHPASNTNDGSILDKDLKNTQRQTQNPLRVKFYIRNSAYPPCTGSSTQTEATCDNYLNAFIRNFKEQYGNVDARLKVASPEGIEGCFGTTENTRVRYGYGLSKKRKLNKDGKCVKRSTDEYKYLQEWIKI